jgi:glycine/D-amino acid oxidase-like deaminating enzyme
VRSSYTAPETGELWMQWAREAMKRWAAWDEEWYPELRSRLWFPTDDLYMRPGWDANTTRLKQLWQKHDVPFEELTQDELRYRYPQIFTEDITACMVEKGAGVVRARRACQAVAGVYEEQLGGKLVISRATPGRPVNGRMEEITLQNGDKLRADAFVFALGPWFVKAFPEVVQGRMRIPIGQVIYYATPANDQRYTFPNMPSFNLPSVTGWPSLPEDARGFRVRGTGTVPGGGSSASAAGGRGADAGGRGTGGRGGPGGAGGGRGGGGRGGRGAGGRGGRGSRGAGTQPGPDGAPNPQGDPDTSVRWFDAVANTRQREFLEARFPGMKGVPINETRACHYESGWSDNFIVDTHPEMSNVWLCGSGNAEAFKSGPVIGEYIAQRVLGEVGDPEVAASLKIPPMEPADTAAGADSTRRALGAGFGPGSRAAGDSTQARAAASASGGGAPPPR